MLFEVLHFARGKKANRRHDLAVEIREQYESQFHQFDVINIDLERGLASFRIDDVPFIDIPLDIPSGSYQSVKVSFEIEIQPSK